VSTQDISADLLSFLQSLLCLLLLLSSSTVQGDRERGGRTSDTGSGSVTDFSIVTAGGTISLSGDTPASPVLSSSYALCSAATNPSNSSVRCWTTFPITLFDDSDARGREEISWNCSNADAFCGGVSSFCVSSGSNFTPPSDKGFKCVEGRSKLSEKASSKAEKKSRRPKQSPSEPVTELLAVAGVVRSREHSASSVSAIIKDSLKSAAESSSPSLLGTSLVDNDLISSADCDWESLCSFLAIRIESLADLMISVCILFALAGRLCVDFSVSIVESESGIGLPELITLPFSRTSKSLITTQGHASTKFSASELLLLNTLNMRPRQCSSEESF